jgi:hypothetical protein
VDLCRTVLPGRRIETLMARGLVPEQAVDIIMGLWR